MRRINMPVFAMSDVYNECCKTIKPGDRKNRIDSYIKILVSAELKYDELMKRESLHFFRESLPETEFVDKDMLFMYEDKMRDGNEFCRQYYDDLRETTKICPFCDIDSVSSLDHYLPKDNFPSLAITPLNLVAMCTECNSKKGEYVDETGNEQILHPYYMQDNLSRIYKVYFDKLNNTANINLNDDPYLIDYREKISFHVARLKLIKRANVEKVEVIENVKRMLETVLVSNNETISDEEKCKNFLSVYPSNSLIEEAIVHELKKNKDFLQSIMNGNTP